MARSPLAVVSKLAHLRYQAMCADAFMALISLLMRREIQMTKCNLTQEPEMVVSCKRFPMHQFGTLSVVDHMDNACTYSDLIKCIGCAGRRR